MIRRLAVLVVRLAAILLPSPLRDWSRAMEAEVAMIERPRAALLFALGSLSCAVREAISFHLVRPLGRLFIPGADAVAGSEVTPMQIRNSRYNRPRALGALCAVGATGLGLAYLTAAGAPGRHLVMNSAALALGLLVLAALASGPRPGVLVKGAIDLSIGSALLLTALLGISADGATRWISVGGIMLQPGLLLLPVLALRFARAPDGSSTLAILIAALALALQPDRAMAGALAAGIIVLAVARPARNILIALAASLTGLGVAILRSDMSPAMPHVDQIFYSSFEVHPLAGAAVLTGTVLIMVPAIGGWLRDAPNRALYSVFGAVWLAVAVAAALGNYPTPFVGYGGSAILGYVISLIGLPSRARDEATARATDAARSSEVDHLRILRAGL